MRLGFLAYTYPLGQIAGPNSPGCAPNDVSFMQEDVRRLQDLSYQAIVSIHAGWEFRYYPAPAQQEAARRLVDSGAAAVLYHHAHVPLGMEVYGGGLIAYGLGNFLCDLHDPYFQSHSSDRVESAVILILGLDESGLLCFEVAPTVIDDDLSVHPQTGKAKEEFLQFLAQLSQPLEDPAELSARQADSSMGSRCTRLLAKGRERGWLNLLAELSLDSARLLERTVIVPYKLRRLKRRLEASAIRIEPNCPPDRVVSEAGSPSGSMQRESLRESSRGVGDGN